MRVEIIVLAVYFIGMISMGLFWNRRAKSSEDYMLGGRSMGPLVTALTLQTTAMSGFMFMGGPSKAYLLGYFAIFYAVGDAGGGLVNISVLGRRMRRLSQLLDAISPIEYLEKRYESIPVKVIACIIAVFGLGCYVLAQFLATGKTLVSLFGFPLEIGLVVGCAVILFYTFVGGYFAVAWTDVIQGFIMIGSLITILILSLIKVGGFTGLNESLAAIDPTYLSIWGKGGEYEGAWGVIAGAVLVYLIGYMGLPHCVNKHMAMANPKTAKTTVVYATIWTQLFCFTPYILGLCGVVLLTQEVAPGFKDPEMVIPTLANLMFPGVVSAIVLTAIMSAIMSTVAALLLLIGTIVSIDFYKRWLRPNATDKSVVFVSKAAIIITGIIGIAVAILKPPGVFDLVVDTFSFMGCAFLPSYVCAVWWKKANATGSVASMIVGGATVQIWSWGGLESVTGMHQFFAGVILSWIAMLIFSQFGKPTSKDMCDLMERAKGKKANVSKKVQVATSKHLSTESKAISQFVFANKTFGQLEAIK
ncbi:sodium/proline symporter [Anaerovorax odorimutans]|uniref:Sodium/proline symporter n=1 Tax=Anaerovorax odorimutans TaxID=109327 RepID=A0ABT1RRB6_9FIRM|nr:sodium/proline symporter [Anaerovorax odorimutans]MCQ4637730.1 sodium/proline symporter [Anaerovorax odorimutans]